MRRQLDLVTGWLDDRTGLPSAFRRFLDEEIPASSGWHQVLGSVALFLFLTQAFTGVMLALNYAPTPGEAYNSIRYIMNEVTGGALMRGLHHWGASFMVVVVVLHMLQVFLWGAYKKPREATWMIGVALLLLTLAYALTGYLLPWDNRAYWGTVVTTQIAASAPVLGPYVLRLMGAEDGVGVVTFARFYSVHVLVLPPLTLLLIAFHIYLVRRHGVAPAPGDEAKPKKKFYPGQVFKDTAAIFVVFAALFTLAVLAKAPLGRLADPTDTAYLPRPEWYFLFLFQLLKLFEGPLEVLASVVLPGAAVALLFAVPFLDRGAARRVTERTAAFLTAGLAGIGWAGLTLAAIATTPPGAVFGDTTGAQEWRELSPEEVAGIGYFHRERCDACHALGVRAEPVAAPGAGPNLGAGPSRRDAAWLIAHFREPATMIPGSTMPPVNLTTAQLNALAAFLLRLTPENAEKLVETPAFAREGAILYQRHRCSTCHQVNGVGQPAGLSLNGLARRRDAAWVMGHFLDPQKYSPGTTMPPYKFDEAENRHLTDYLLALP
jgi:ubiquinol-cytochrome c reductase cytochrome b subunit